MRGAGFMRGTVVVAGMMAALGAGMVLAPAPAVAFPLYPWCAQYGGRGGSTNCYFTSFPQCQATIPGRGGYCYENPWYRAYGSFHTPTWRAVGPYGYDAPVGPAPRRR